MSSGSGGSSEERAEINTLPREEGPRHRPLDPKREWTAVGLVVLSLVMPFGLGALGGVLPHDVPLEPRAAWVLGMASCFALAGVMVQREASGRGRFLPLLLLLVPLAHLIRSGSSLFASLDGGLYLLLAGSVALRAPYRFLVRYHASKVSRRFTHFAILLAILPGPLVTVAFGIFSILLLPAVSRLLHPAPQAVGEERAADFTTRDGLTLRATYWPGLPSAPAIVLVHGLGDGRDRVLAWARAFHERGAHVLAYDARGHSASEGALITYADREPDDVLRAADHLMSLSHAAPGDIVVFGISMGGGATLAALPDLSRLGMHHAVLFAPASNYDALVSGRLPPPPLRGLTRGIVYEVSHALGFLAPTELVPERALYHARSVEVLVFHGRADRTIDPALTEAMEEAHPNVTVRWLPEVGHNEIAEAVLADPSLAREVYAWIGLADP